MPLLLPSSSSRRIASFFGVLPALADMALAASLGFNGPVAVAVAVAVPLVLPAAAGAAPTLLPAAPTPVFLAARPEDAVPGLVAEEDDTAEAGLTLPVPTVDPLVADAPPTPAALKLLTRRPAVPARPGLLVPAAAAAPSSPPVSLAEATDEASEGFLLVVMDGRASGLPAATGALRVESGVRAPSLDAEPEAEAEAEVDEEPGVRVEADGALVLVLVPYVLCRVDGRSGGFLSAAGLVALRADIVLLFY